MHVLSCLHRNNKGDSSFPKGFKAHVATFRRRDEKREPTTFQAELPSSFLSSWTVFLSLIPPMTGSVSPGCLFTSTPESRGAKLFVRRDRVLGWSSLDRLLIASMTSPWSVCLLHRRRASGDVCLLWPPIINAEIAWLVADTPPLASVSGSSALPRVCVRFLSLYI